jgi:hypothetical protein
MAILKQMQPWTKEIQGNQKLQVMKRCDVILSCVCVEKRKSNKQLIKLLKKKEQLIKIMLG